MTVARSYQFAGFSESDRRAELQRLRAQATLLWERELMLLRGAGLAVGGTSVEVGCGPGFIAGSMAAATAPGRVIGVDVCEELLDIAREVVEPEQGGVRFVHGSAYSTGLPDACADFVYNRMLYQHLDAPAKALDEVRRILRPGGRVCIVDVDDAWLSLYPQCDAFDRLTTAAQHAQAERGGDRRIGRKLPGLLSAAGFTDVTAEVVSVSSLELGITTFLDLTTRFKALQCGAAAADLVDEVYRFAADHDAFGVTGVFAVSGTA
jgi:SAM-dependent methyltransferase